MKHRLRFNSASRQVFRRGFTIIELVIAISVITVPIALLLPAVQQVRESSRRITCQNHIRQLGLACEQTDELQGCVWGELGGR